MSEWDMEVHSLWGGEEVGAVGGDGINGALMSSDLPEGRQRVRVPQLEHPPSATAQQGRAAGHQAQRTHPVAVGVWHLLRETGTLQSSYSSPPPVSMPVNRPH